MRLKLSLFFCFISIYSWSQTTDMFTTSGTFTVPAGVTSITGKAWGGGGSGGGASGAGLLVGRGAAGGGGGAYVSSVLAVTPGAALSVVVAGQTFGTTGANGTAGGNSTITGFEASFLAAGGSGGGANNTGTAPGATAGGTVAASAGTTRIAGVAGGAGNSALLSLGLFSGAGGAGGNSGGAGGVANSSLILGTAPGNIGTAPGGGGGGAINSALGVAQIGGTGGAGEISITYTCPTYNITGTSATNVCLSVGTTSTVTLTSSALSLPVGNYVVTYNRSSPSATGLTANMTVSTAGTGGFTAVGLTTAGSSTITVTALTSGACSSNPTTNNTATITVSALPTITLAASAVTVCSSSSAQNTTLSYSATTNTPTSYSIVWNASPANTFVAVTNAVLGASPITIAVPAGTAVGTYTGTLTVNNAAGCVSSSGSSFSVTVNPLPTITLSATTASVCFNTSAQNTTLAYSATSGTPTTYSIVWNVSPSNTFSAVTNASLSASPITIAVPAGTVGGTYTGTLTVKNANGCVSSGTSFTVTVNDLPTITLSAATASVCFNTSAQNTTLAYSATSGTPTTYSIVWNVSPSNTFAAVTNASLSASPIAIAVPAGTVGGTYTGTLTVKNANGCVSSGTSFTVTVNDLPTITLSAATASVCFNANAQNTTLAYSATSGTPTTYSIVWNVSPSNTFAAVTNVSLSASPITIAVPAGTVGGTYTGTLTVKNANGCVSSGTSFTVTVNDLPTITLSATTASVCFNTSVQNTTLAYSATSGTPTTYSIVWNVSPSNTFAAVTNASLSASPITIIVPAGTVGGTYTGTLTVKNANGCVSSGTSFTVIVNDLPTIALSATTASVCFNTSVQNTTLAYSATSGTPTTYSIVWNVSPSNTFAAVTNASLSASPIAIAVPAGTVGGTYTGTLTVKNANGCVSTGSIFTVTVNALPTITTTGTMISVCTSAGSQNATLIYTATTGTPSGYSIDWNATANTNLLADQLNTSFAFSPTGGSLNTIVVPANVVAGTYSGIMTITNANCNTTQAVSITINATPTAPTIGLVTPPTCTVPFGSVPLSGLPSGNWTIVTNPVTVTTSGSGSSAVITNLAPNSYTFTVSNSVTGCTSSASLPATVASLVTNYWNGSGWTSGTPNINQNIVFSGNFTSSTGTAGDINGCSCQVNSGIKVVFDSGATLSIINAVNVNTNAGTSLTFKNNASLLQTNNVSNSGNIIYNRTTTAMNALDYTYWSSPVSGQKFNLLSPNSDPNKLYSYNNGWVAESATNAMTVGKGYLIRVPKAGTWPNGEIVSYPYSQSVSFTGTPNNGNITGQTVTVLDEPYLIGNPYPSAMDAKAFLTANNLVLEGTLYLWTHNTPIADNGNLGFLYTANDYAVYNFTGGTGTSAAINPGVNNSVPSGQIASGQSFFAKSIASSGTIVFNNNMRIAGNNTQFFRPAKDAFVGEGRIWLNLTNTNGFFKQVLIGYVDGATNEYDNKYDGVKFDVEQMADFYSIASDKKFIIQGRALPFDVSDTVPLGYSSAIIGNYTIAIDHSDGLLANQEVYLEDKVTNTIHNLYNGGYTFATKDGVFEDRFVFRYTNKTLGTDEFNTSKNLIFVAVENKEIKISAPDQTIDKVFIYDMSGKLIYKKEAVGNPELVIEYLKSSNQVLVVKVILDNKLIETKKVIY
ncbi:T9SS sorting signal type C domain-containing protein [Flavobacterium sp. LS1R47]|uniref:T9SS sorting signal type C domain-containing protein n=1 Tax=Flavobacterium frigoritolerans TaxID=2987686 RepID=A0A9X3C8L8_9FLAO|nr:T9SS sorting signal type C domain-containing protein [Flavobacterium frigoritolerans]MCV9931978.1 T9SS sorting signal type C domain-containing protein [Flavobacterium frigoritolerans]